MLDVRVDRRLDSFVLSQGTGGDEVRVVVDDMMDCLQPLLIFGHGCHLI